ncbi:MAG: hypothetical protein ACRDLD_16705 [Thermoleophilaceae bacterium]
MSRSISQARIASTCAGARQTTARSRLPDGFSTALTGFDSIQRQRMACLNIAWSTTIETRTACRPTPALSS